MLMISCSREGVLAIPSPGPDASLPPTSSDTPLLVAAFVLLAILQALIVR